MKSRLKNLGRMTVGLVLGTWAASTVGVYATESSHNTEVIYQDDDLEVSLTYRPHVMPAAEEPYVPAPILPLPPSSPSYPSYPSYPGYPDYTGGRSDWDKAKVVIDDLIELGSKAWEFVNANKPVATTETQTASAVPKGVDFWTDLQGWETPNSHLFQLVFKNKLGSRVVDLSYRIVYGWGGTFDGKGHFLSDVTVLPTEIITSWGYTVTATSKIVGVVNVSKVKGDPIAAMQVQLDFDIQTPIKRIDLASRYFVRGDGLLIDLATRKEYRD